MLLNNGVEWLIFLVGILPALSSIGDNLKELVSEHGHVPKQVQTRLDSIFQSRISEDDKPCREEYHIIGL